MKMNGVRKLVEKDFDAFINIAANAYPAFKMAAEEEKQKTKERFLKTEREQPLVRFYGLFREEKLLGGMRFFDFTMNFEGRKIPAGGVGFVAVDLMHKKESAAREMIEYFIRYYRDNGACFTLLYPFRPDFYKKMGFGYGPKISQYKVRPEALPKGGCKGCVDFLSSDDKGLIKECYERYTNKTHGMIEKFKASYDVMFMNPENRVAGFKKDGKITGYITFEFKPGEKDSFLINDIHVGEFIYEDREALLGIMEFLRTQADQIRYVVFNTQDENFHNMLSDPRNGSDNLIPSVYHESNTQGVGLMYRVTDIKLFFSALKEHNFGGESIRLKLTIKDSFIPENQGSTIVYFNRGKADTAEDGEYDAEVTMDIAEFSSMAIGAARFKDLYNYGLADISNPAFTDTVNKLFAHEEKPKCTTAF